MKVSGALEAFLARHRNLVLVEVATALGSTPRERGAWMRLHFIDEHADAPKQVEAVKAEAVKA